MHRASSVETATENGSCNGLTECTYRYFFFGKARSFCVSWIVSEGLCICEVHDEIKKNNSHFSWFHQVKFYGARMAKRSPLVSVLISRLREP